VGLLADFSKVLNFGKVGKQAIKYQYDSLFWGNIILCGESFVPIKAMAIAKVFS